MKGLIRVGLVLSLTFFFITPIKSGAISANPSPNCSAGTTCTVTFSYTGDYYAWTVPSGVTSLTIDISGAQGGTSNEMYSPQAGGLGGRLTATLQVTSGQILYVYVGGQPSVGSSSGGWNGGGAGGNSTAGLGGAGGYAGGGGGATDLRTSTNATDRLVVAGGGGGGGRDYVNGGCAPCGVGGTGGTGGGTTGGAGSNSGANGYSYGTGGGGGGGTQVAGGSAGSGVKPGTAGSSAVGGSGASGAQDVAGGGGGGGYFGGGGGSSPGDGNGGGGGGGGGGSSYSHPTLATSVTNTQGFKSGNGSASITYLNSPVPTTFSTNSSSPTNISTGTTISYSLILSQSVSDLATSDFQFGGTSSCNTPGLTGSGTTYTVTVTNCSEGTLILQLKANSVTGTSTGPPTVSSANTVVIDRTGPTISSVSAPANGTYFPAGTLNFTVNFSESVTVTGSPRLTLTLNGSGSSVTEYATFVSLSDSKTATFRYTVGSDVGEYDSDGIEVTTSLDLNSGSIADLATNALSSLTFGSVNSASVYIAQPPTAPSITSISAANASLSVTFSASIAQGSAVTIYQYSTNNGSTWKTRTDTATVSATSTTMTITVRSDAASALVNDTTYQVRLRAVSAAGNSDSSTAASGTPTAILVSGGSDITTTFGNSASSSQFTASGGTSPYNFTLSATPTGVSITNGVVTASSSTPVGTYTQNVIATDAAARTGVKQIVITVNRASQSTLTITTTSGIFGTTLTLLTSGGSGTGAVSYSYSAGTTTCSLSSSNLTASGAGTCLITATKAADGSYNQVSSAQTTITFESGATSAAITISAGTLVFRQTKNISAVASVAGKLTFKANNVVISGCKNLPANASNSFTRSCSYRPSTRGYITITVELNPTNQSYSGSTTSSEKYFVTNRTGTR